MVPKITNGWSEIRGLSTEMLMIKISHFYHIANTAMLTFHEYRTFAKYSSLRLLGTIPLPRDFMSNHISMECHTRTVVFHYYKKILIKETISLILNKPRRRE